MANNVLDSFLIELGYSLGSGENDKLKQFLGGATRIFQGHTVDLNKVMEHFAKTAETSGKKAAKGTKEVTEETEKSGTKLLKQFRGAAVAAVQETATIVRHLATWQAATIGTFSAVGLSVIGIADSVAMADQKYRLLGQRMFMTAGQMREVAGLQKILGANMDQIPWDPELMSRVPGAMASLDAMNATMGPQYEAQMKKIRDIRVEFNKLQVELSYIVPVAVGDFMKMLGASPDSVLSKLQALNGWIMGHGPEISRDMAKYVLPVFQDWESIMKNLGGLAEHVGQAVMIMVGAFSGDRALQQGALTMTNISGTIDHIGNFIGDVSKGLAGFVNGVTTAADAIVQLGMAIEHVVQAGIDLGHLRFAAFHADMKMAGGSMKAMMQDVTPASGSVMGMALGGGVGAGLGAWGGAEAGAGIGSAFGPVGTLAGGLIGGFLGTTSAGSAGALVGTGVGYGAGKLMNGRGIQIQPIQGLSESGRQAVAASVRGISIMPPAQAQKALAASGVDWAAAVKPYGFDPRVLQSLALNESSGSGFWADGSVKVNPRSGARGLMQFMPGLAWQMGFNPDDPQQSADNAAKLLSQLLGRYHGDTKLAVEAYNDGPKNLELHMQRDGGPPAETALYWEKWQKNYQMLSGKPPVNMVFNQTFQVPPGVTPYRYADEVMKKMQSRQHMELLSNYVAADGIFGP